MGDDLPQGNGVRVGTAVKVGVRVGMTVAVFVAGVAGDTLGAAMLAGVPQPAKTERIRIQEESFTLCPLRKCECGFIEVWRQIEQQVEE